MNYAAILYHLLHPVPNGTARQLKLFSGAPVRSNTDPCSGSGPAAVHRRQLKRRSNGQRATTSHFGEEPHSVSLTPGRSTKVWRLSSESCGLPRLP